MTELVEAVARAIAEERETWGIQLIWGWARWSDTEIYRVVKAPGCSHEIQGPMAKCRAFVDARCAAAAIAAVRDHDEAERKAARAAEDERARIWSEGVTARIKALGTSVDRSKDGRERIA